MKLNLNKNHRSMGITLFLVIAGSILFYYMVFHTRNIRTGIRNVLSIMAPIIYGAVIAYLLNPVINFMENKIFFPFFRRNDIVLKERGKRVTRWVSVIIALVLFLCIILAVVMMILPQSIRSIMNVIYSFPRYVEVVQHWIDDLLHSRGWDLEPSTADLINQYVQQAQDFLTTELLPQMQDTLRQITSGIFDIVNFLKNFLIGAIVSCYVLSAKESFVAKCKMLTYAVLPSKSADLMIDAMRYTHQTMGGFISGKIIDSAIIGVLCYVSITFMKMPYALLVSTVIGVTNIIPFFGPFLGAIPCFVLILLVNPIKGLYFLIFILVLQQFDGNILGPKILGDSTGLSSFMVIVAILIGGGFFGFPGMVLGVPVTAVLYTAIWRQVGKSLKSKNLPEDEASYTRINKMDPATGHGTQIPVQEQQKPERERRNFFMLVWNAIMKIVIPVWNVVIGFISFAFGRLIYFFIWGFEMIKRACISSGHFFGRIGKGIKRYFSGIYHSVINRQKELRPSRKVKSDLTGRSNLSGNAGSSEGSEPSVSSEATDGDEPSVTGEAAADDEASATGEVSADAEASATGDPSDGIGLPVRIDSPHDNDMPGGDTL